MRACVYLRLCVYMIVLACGIAYLLPMQACSQDFKSGFTTAADSGVARSRFHDALAPY